MGSVVSFVVAGLLPAFGSYQGEINAMAAPEAGARTRFIVAPADGVKGGLEFQEYATQVGRALTSRGFILADDASADLIVHLSYGITSHQTVASGTRMSMARPAGPTDYSKPMVQTQVPVIRSRTENRRILELSASAYDPKNSNLSKPELWMVRVVSIGPSDDLREAIPILIAMSQPYLAQNLKNKHSDYLRPNSDKTKYIRGEIDTWPSEK